MTRKKIIFIIFVNLALIGVQFYFTCRRASDGDRLTNLQNERQQLETENTKLQSDIFQSTSLAEISRRAEAQQLVPLKTTTLAPVPVAAVFSNQP